MFNSLNLIHKFPNTHKDCRWKTPYANRVYNSVLDFVGNTPLIKLNKIPKDHGLSCEIYAKCEFLNPAGSCKDRIALAMVQDAEAGGHIADYTHLVEATSGNTGIGIAFNAALLNKKCSIVLGDKNSTEKVNTMRLLGADVIQTKNSPLQIARQIKDANPNNVVMLNQFENHVNPRIHYDTSGAEILDALGEVDMLVVGAGSGGTVTGVGYKIKERYPKCTIIVGEPEGSTMFDEHGQQHPFLVEGIGGASVPIVLDKSIIDDFEVISDEESFLMAREVIKKEGLLCGGSSGTIMAAAIRAARKRKLGAGKRIVVVMPDGIRNYMTKFVTDQWMEAHLFMDPPEHSMKWWNHAVADLSFHQKYPLINSKRTCAEALKEMNNLNIAIVVNENGWFVGAITKDNLRHNATNPTKLPNQKSQELNLDDPVSDHLVKDCYTIAKNGRKGMPTIGHLSRILDITQFVILGTNVFKANIDHFVPENVVTADIVLNYILKYSPLKE